MVVAPCIYIMVIIKDSTEIEVEIKDANVYMLASGISTDQVACVFVSPS